MSAAEPPLCGIVLAGGRSRRMQTDKALIAYHGRPQVLVTLDLLVPFCAETFISCRPDQWPEASLENLPMIHDLVPDQGPMGGLEAAFARRPDAAWLVTACDLPYLSADVLARLCAERNPQAIATAYRSAHDNLPEPLCAIYEPAAAALIRQNLAEGRRCPRKMLISANTHLLDLPRVDALDNINHREEHREALNRLRGAKT